ncbi:MAG: SirB2 family protein [Gammaproteobacteria bacterium]|nr:SirB2 family protein [Gammaproteobacteria bacterium]
MTEFYPDIKLFHIATVVASGSLFALRGFALQLGGQWAMAAPLRYLSYGIDTLLLTAAILLLTILPAAVYANGWLAVKLVLLLVYIVLGSYALKRGRTASIRRICFVAALLVYASMFAIARTHHPLGLIMYFREWLT